METITELYSPEALERVRRRNRLWTAALLFFSLAALAVCVSLCLRATTLTADFTEKRVVILSTLCGWTVIALWLELVLPWRREAVHMAHMLSGERECAEGVLTVTDELLRIPHSAPLLRAELRSGEQLHSLTVSPRRAKLLGETPRRVRVWTVFGCIVAWEALDEGD